MAYDEQLAKRVEGSLSHSGTLSTQKMMGGAVFMLNGKMCAYVQGNSLIIRCEPEITEELLKKPATRRMVMHGKTAKQSWIAISPDGLQTGKEFDIWLSTALAYNQKITEAKHA